ncbi:MAG TPA: M48 family metalloprotease [Gemmatimonadales bacterium]|nr:M48 family metalloprotease [Gemmatimonadales bacterium]
MIAALPCRSTLLAALLLAAACATNPVTGKSEISLVSEEQEIAMGRQTRDDALRTFGEYPDPEAQALVRRIGMEMAKKSERPALPWEFHVIDDDQVNAFAAPGGFIFITRGILSHMNSEAELASVLGHEIGHVTARHSAQQVSKAQLAQLGLGVGMIFSSTLREAGGALSAGLQLLFLKFGRDAESQADDLGFRYMVADGYDPNGAAEMFRTLGRVSARAGQRLPEWASTHPDPGNRVAKTEQRIDSLAGTGRDPATLKENEAQFVRLLDGMTYGQDPRKGFFRGSTFYHPELRFQFAFPQGWKTANLPDQVVAQSPEGNEVLQLQVGKGTPQQMAQKFFQQQGLRAGQVTSGSVNGLDAVTGDFSAQLEDGTPIAGSAGFLAYGSRTYALVGFAASSQGGSVSQQFGTVLRSFRPLTDPAILNARPATVRTVRVPRDMTVQDFNEEYPSTIPLEELALINGVDGPASTLETGRMAKQVRGGLGAQQTARDVGQGGR